MAMLELYLIRHGVAAERGEQDLPQFTAGQARADDRAVQVGIEFPDLRAPRRRLPFDQRCRDRAEVERPRQHGRSGRS